MTAKEQIHAEIENVREEDLAELYELVRRFASAKTAPSRKTGALSRIKHIQINAPEDFAANLDLYMSGEKQIAADQDVH